MLLFWELLSFWVGTDLVPDIDQTYGAIQSGIAAGWYLPNLQNSLIALGLGFLLAALGGFVIGVALGLNDTLFELFEPFVLNTYAIPKVVRRCTGSSRWSSSP
jgi:ABC-type nitrate/sulfonate/bicarbonate transport system permease component